MKPSSSANPPGASPADRGIDSAPASTEQSLAPGIKPTPLAPPAPLALVLAITVVNSAAGFVVSSGAHFIAERIYKSSETQNAVMGLLYGVAYIAGSLAIGPLNRLFSRRSAGFSPRAQLLAIMAMLALGAMVPLLVNTREALAVYACVYGLLSGAMWPLTEAYLSGGRTGAELRRTIGRFNILWSGAIVACAWAMGPLNEWAPMLSIGLLIPLHAAALVLVFRLPNTPAGAVGEEPVDGHPHAAAEIATYRARLRGFRTLLLLSNALMASISPVFPALLGRLGFEEGLKTPFLSVWLAARVATFWIMERDHRWHGARWLMPLGCAAVFPGYALLMFVPNVAVVAVGLALFGAGMGVIYCAALYYAMELSGGGADQGTRHAARTQIDEGGTHEALIGVGFTLGPVIALGVAAILG